MFKKKQKLGVGLSLDEELKSIDTQRKREGVDIMREKTIRKKPNDLNNNKMNNRLITHGVQVGKGGVQCQKSAPNRKMVSDSHVKFRNEIMQLNTDVVDHNMEKFVRQKLEEIEQIQMGGMPKQLQGEERQRDQDSHKELIDVNQADETVQQKTIMIQGLREVICPFEEKVRNLEVIENLKRKRLFETINVDKVLNQEKSKKQQKSERHVQKQFGKFFKNDGRSIRTLLMKRQIDNWKYEQALQKECRADTVEEEK